MPIQHEPEPASRPRLIGNSHQRDMRRPGPGAALGAAGHVKSDRSIGKRRCGLEQISRRRLRVEAARRTAAGTGAGIDGERGIGRVRDEAPLFRKVLKSRQSLDVHAEEEKCPAGCQPNLCHALRHGRKNELSRLLG